MAYSPFGFSNARRGFGQQGFNQNPYDFKGLESRLGKIETGIAGLTDQFKNFPGQEGVDPVYTGGTAPNPLAPATPTGGISSLPEAAPTPAAPAPTQQTPSPFGSGIGGGQLGRHITYQPGQEGFTPLTAEQFAGQQDLWGRRQDYNKFAGMAGDVAGVGTGGIRSLRGANPSFGHAYESWQGADQSQGMENFLQNYSFDLSPQGPQGPNRHEFMQEFQAANPIGLDTTGTSTWYNTYGQPVDMDAVRERNKNERSGWQQAQQDFQNTPEYQTWQQERDAWQQREEGRGPLSQSTIQAMGGVQSSSPIPDIDPFISMGLGSPTATPTYEGYMDMVNRGRESYRPQTATSTPSLGGPIQQQIQQGLGSLGYNV